MHNFMVQNYSVKHFIFHTKNRWLAEPDDGAHCNHWIVDQLLQRLPNDRKINEELDGPHYDDEWWIGAKSYVRFLLC